MFKHAEIDTDILNRPMIDMNRPIIDFQFTEEGGRRFAVFTKANVGKRVAIVWDAEVLAAPFIATPITGGSGEITGDFSAEEAAEIVRSINGSKPQTPVILHQSAFPPSRRSHLRHPRPGQIAPILVQDSAGCAAIGAELEA